MDETTGSTHDLLLALAGRLDDDMLALARELVAVGEDTRAVELVAAGLAADGTALPAPLRAALVDAARAARIDLDADAALPAAATAGPEHRFTADPASGDDRVAQAVAALPARLLDGAEVLLTWRLTPAGSAPGPLPHPVVLVEVEPAGRPADVLAYQLSVGLDRAGVVASVEVLTGGRPLSGYHAAARREARRIDGSAAAPPVTAPPPVTEPEPEPEPAVARSVFAEPEHAEPDVAEPDVAEPVPEPAVPATPPAEPAGSWSAGLFGVADEPSEPDAAATDPTGDVVGPRSLPRRAARGADPEPRPSERRRTTVTPLSRAFMPSPVPLARRDGGRARPLAPVADEQGQVPALADTPTFRSMQDPLSGPVNAPLLAPLLDPTPRGGTDDVSDGDESARHDLAPDGGSDDDPFGPGGISPLAPDRTRPAPAPVEDRWANEWASGDWAVSPQDLRSGGEPDQPVDEPRPAPEDRPRHGVLLGTPAEPPPPAPSAPLGAAPRNPAPEPRPERPAVSPPRPGPGGSAPSEPADEEQADDLGLRPDAVARLSDADRELLARLQSELGTGSRPRTSRRAGVARPRSNGKGRLGPPDLAG